MTTNQTIDGVPRGLIERTRRELAAGTPSIATLAELRALLDAPAIKPRPFGYWLTPKTCAGLAMFQRELIEDPVLTASVVEYFHVTPLYDAPAKPQGEPVAWCIDREEPGHLGGYCSAAMKASGVGFQGHTKPLYAEQPAPVAVASRDESVAWLKRIDGIGQARAELIYSMGFRRHTDVPQSR
ncbi:hypothetical protein [Pseudomonas marginalis]|uniref:hypothetical protein n=1 Tax=Pseudomonas marginalis TaxID=298 RepID=UPI0011B4E943|nr:hypothetical protein [Pseudomonas marginalis]KAA8555173.1 hypothetical protein FX984_01791 [Pseudomonas marginalis]TWR71922.1 hypothetical protein FIV40_09475 [Pseudomonas marginalis]